MIALQSFYDSISRLFGITPYAEKVLEHIKPDYFLSDTKNKILDVIYHNIVPSYTLCSHLVILLPILTNKEISKLLLESSERRLYEGRSRYDHDYLEKLSMFDDNFFYSDEDIDNLPYLNDSQKKFIKGKRIELLSERDELRKMEKELHVNFCKILESESLSGLEKNELQKLMEEKKVAINKRIENIYSDAIDEIIRGEKI